MAPMMHMPAPMAEIRQLQMPAGAATSFLVADLLDDFGAQQAVKDAALLARKTALKQRVAEAEAQAVADAEKAAKKQADKLAKTEAAQAAKAAKAEAEAAAKRAAREAKDAAASAKAGGSATTPKSAEKAVGEVVKVNKQAERIAERKARGEAAPSLFPL
jgi:colicin import membrane protein